MDVVNHLMPKAEQLQALVAKGDDRPIAMVNLLKFRDKAQYKDGSDADMSGREAYMRYGREMSALVAAQGGRILFSGMVKSLVIGDVGDLWDVVAIMEYPSAAAFFRIATSPEVARIAHHREAGLAGQLLIETVAPGGG